jgi:hypothetical protein
VSIDPRGLFFASKIIPTKKGPGPSAGTKSNLGSPTLAALVLLLVLVILPFFGVLRRVFPRRILWLRLLRLSRLAGLLTLILFHIVCHFIAPCRAEFRGETAELWFVR